MEDIAILVNKDNPVDINYEPKNLVEVANPYYHASFGDCKLTMVDFVSEAFKDLNNEAKE